jgi:hypothetical protein
MEADTEEADTEQEEWPMFERRHFAQLALLAVPLALIGYVGLSGEMATAADHTDPPAEFGGLSNPTPDSADIADVYAWHTDTELNAIITFSGLKGPEVTEADYAQDVVYTLHIDNTGDDVESDVQIFIRFGQDADGNWGVQAQNIPGEPEPIVGPVDQTLSGDAAMLRTGLFDDPFFFDIQGFIETTSTGDFSFTGTDGLAGTNTGAIILQIPLDEVTADESTFDVWATTHRLTQ